MGKRPAGVELFEGNMVSMQRGIRPSMQRDEPPTMETGLERIADKCCEPTPEERSAGNLHATFCGRRRQVTASAHPVGGQQWPSLPESKSACRGPIKGLRFPQLMTEIHPQNCRFGY